MRRLIHTLMVATVVAACPAVPSEIRAASVLPESPVRADVWAVGEPPGDGFAPETIARECDLHVIAEGYLRTPRLFPVNLEVKEYPLKKLLDSLTRIWRCEWRFLDEEETTILVRAEAWWLEDVV